MRSALRTKGLRAPHVTPTTLPAPIGGWNARDSLAEMPATDAIALTNLFPKTSTIDVRGGSLGPRIVGSYPSTLAVYNALDGGVRLFAFGGGAPWEIVDYADDDGIAEVVLDSAGASYQLASNRFIWTMFGDGTQQYLIAVNGMDNPLYYWGQTFGGLPQFTVIDGSTSPALSGVTLSDINYVNVYKGRLFFLFRDSLAFGYLSAGAAGGAIATFPLDAEAKRGGRLVAMASWTRDAGDGQDDVAVFLTSEGEAIIYQGNDPSNAVNWGKVGTFFIGRPLGNRCVMQYGGDLLVLTENGIFPLSSALQTAQISNQYAISFKIEKAFTDAARAYGQNAGWRLIHYPAQNALIVNVPIQEDVEHEQYVMNTITKAWCKFTNWNAADWAVANGKLYFSMQWDVAGYALQAWVGSHDHASYAYYLETTSKLRSLAYDGRQAFSYLGSPEQKRVTALRPVLDVPGDLTYHFGVDVEFQQTDTEGSITYRSFQAVWDAGVWDRDVWPVEPEIARDLVTAVEHPGFALSVKFAGEVNDAPTATVPSTTTELDTDPHIRWIATDLMIERGGIL